MKIKKLFLIASIISSIFLAAFVTSCQVPGDVDIQQGSKLFAQKRYNDARACFELALTEECNFPKETIYVYISNCYSQTGEYEKAIEYRKMALEIVEDPSNYLKLGMIYRVIQDDDSAEEMFKKALALYPSADAYASLGALYMTREDFKKAAENLENSLDLSDKNGFVHADLAICYAKLGMFEEAEEEYEWARKLKCDNLEVFRQQLNQIMDK